MLFRSDAGLALKYAGASDIYACATHPILSGNAAEELNESEYKEIVVTDTIQIPEENQIDKLKVLTVAPIFAQALTLIYHNQSVDTLFSKKDNI